MEKNFGSIIKMEKATKMEIKKYYNDKKDSDFPRFFAYIKFFEYEGKKYGIVGGKTNYTNPDLSFDYLDENKLDNRYSRNFLHEINAKWDETIVIVNQKTSISKDTDNDKAEFIECYLQRRFNLFDS